MGKNEKFTVVLCGLLQSEVQVIPGFDEEKLRQAERRVHNYLQEVNYYEKLNAQQPVTTYSIKELQC